MMRAARVLSVEPDTAYTLRVSQQPASLRGRGARIGQPWAESMLITMGRVPWRMAYHRGYLFTYFGRYQATGRLQPSGIGPEGRLPWSRRKVGGRRAWLLRPRRAFGCQQHSSVSRLLEPFTTGCGCLRYASRVSHVWMCKPPAKCQAVRSGTVIYERAIVPYITCDVSQLLSVTTNES